MPTPARDRAREVALDLTAPAEPARVAALREAARAFAAGHGLPRPGDVAQAVWEACAGALAAADRGTPSSLRLTGVAVSDRLRFSITERASDGSAMPDTPRAPRTLAIIVELADDVTVTRADGGATCVRIDFALPATATPRSAVPPSPSHRDAPAERWAAAERRQLHAWARVWRDAARSGG